MCGLQRQLLNKDIRREKQNSLNNLTTLQVQLGKEVKGNRAATAAVAAFASSRNPCDKLSSSTPSTLTAAKSRVSRWRWNKVYPLNDLKANNGSQPSLDRTVLFPKLKSHVTLNSLAMSCISGTTLFGELSSDISNPSSFVSQHQSKWPSPREVLSSNSMYSDIDDAASVFSDVDSTIINDD